MPKNKTWEMLTRSPRTADEWAWRTQLRLGALAVGALGLVIAIRLWWLTLLVGLVAVVIWLVKQAR